MALYDKPGAADGPKDRRTHYPTDPYERKSREIKTIQKKLFGFDQLSRKERQALEDSTIDRMSPKVSYSMNKARRWEMCQSPEKLVERYASDEHAYPVAAVDRFFIGNGYSNKAYSEKSPEKETKSVKVKSGNGAHFLSLQDCLAEKPSTSGSPKKAKGQSLMEFVERPSVLYCIEDHHSDELFFRRVIGKSKMGGWTSKRVKEVDMEDYSDVYVDEVETEDVDDSNDSDDRKDATLADFIVTRPSKANKKKRSSPSFEIIDEIPKLSSGNKVPTLTNTTQLVDATFIKTRFMNINTECLPLPDFKPIEFMFDFFWLDENKTKCLFVIPKASDDAYANFSSILTLELVDNKKKRMRMTVKSVFDSHIAPASNNSHKATQEVVVTIQKLWEQGINLLNKIKENSETSTATYQPQTSIYPMFNPIGDYALLGLYKSQSRMSETSFDVIDTEACSFCGHDTLGNTTMLKCGHIYCRFCAEKLVKSQIIEGADRLSCALCASPLESSFVLVHTPLTLLQAYLRFTFLQQPNTIECPNKCGVAPIDEDLKFNGTQCSRCKTVICVKCKREPHYPLTCDQMNLWETRFLPQYIAETEGSITCDCPSEDLELHKCHRNCHHKRLQLWKNCNNLVPYFRNPYFAKAIDPLLSDRKPAAPNNVTASIASTCIEARYKRIYNKYIKAVIKHFGDSFTSKAKEFREILLTALHFLEFGFAWLYFSRKHKSFNYKCIKASLYNLRALYTEMESRLSTNNVDEAVERLVSMDGVCKSLLDKF